MLQEVGNRAYKLKEGERGEGPVVYWMSRDQRVHDNWALIYSLEIAREHTLPVSVAFSFSNGYPNANARNLNFMIEGLKVVEQQLHELGIAFHVLLGTPPSTIPTLLSSLDAFALVSDFDPLRLKREWKDEVNTQIRIPHIEVDAHNIVPCRVVSDKAEYGAYTLRPKIKRLQPQYLTDIPPTPLPPVRTPSSATDWDKVWQWLDPLPNPEPVAWLKPGAVNATEQLNRFIGNGLKGYATRRNDPLADAQSNLSPYLHFGHISAQRVAISIIRSDAGEEDKSAFLEELIVRRELSDNFCFYNPNYDNPKGFHPWARATLSKHRGDSREYTYTLKEFEEARTHDSLWNAAQIQLVRTGKMHGYMRMYWGKKILEWTPTPDDAMSIAIELNDKYSLDGRDPNGYAGIAWCIGGTHDRPWGEREVFGMIRYMNENGCKRKFNVSKYIEAYGKS